MQTNREVLAALVWTYCVRLADAQKRVEILANRGAEERSGKLLLHLTTSRIQKYGETSGEPSIAVLSVSHNELAQMAAMSRPHVSVTMNKLRQLGLVSYARNQPLSIDIVKLRTYLTGE